MRLMTARNANLRVLETPRQTSDARLSKIMSDLQMLLASEYRRGERFGAAQTIRAMRARGHSRNKVDTSNKVDTIRLVEE
jgi:hypothetical protein